MSVMRALSKTRSVSECIIHSAKRDLIENRRAFGD